MTEDIIRTFSSISNIRRINFQLFDIIRQAIEDKNPTPLHWVSYNKIFPNQR